MLVGHLLTNHLLTDQDKYLKSTLALRRENHKCNNPIIIVTYNSFIKLFLTVFAVSCIDISTKQASVF